MGTFPLFDLGKIEGFREIAISIRFGPSKVMNRSEAFRRSLESQPDGHTACNNQER
jgi:hypothetical protein